MAERESDERRRDRSGSRYRGEGAREYASLSDQGREQWNPDVERGGRDWRESRSGAHSEDWRSPDARYGGQEYDEGRMTTYRGQSSQGRGGWGEGPGGSQGGTRWGQGSVAGQSMGYWNEGTNRGPYTGRGPKNYRRPDDRICEDINERLTEDGEIDATNIECSVKNGVATLTGTVESRRIRRRAEEVVENISGVRDVENQLRVEESGEGQERTMAAGGGTRRERGETGEEGRSTAGSSRRSRG